MKRDREGWLRARPGQRRAVEPSERWPEEQELELYSARTLDPAEEQRRYLPFDDAPEEEPWRSDDELRDWRGAFVDEPHEWMRRDSEGHFTSHRAWEGNDEEDPHPTSGVTEKWGPRR